LFKTTTSPFFLGGAAFCGLGFSSSEESSSAFFLGFSLSLTSSAKATFLTLSFLTL